MRMNMGVLSTILSNRFLAEGSRAIFSIDYYTICEELQNFFSHISKEKPLIIENKKIVSGFMPLVPINKDNNYIAYIIAEKAN